MRIAFINTSRGVHLAHSAIDPEPLSEVEALLAIRGATNCNEDCWDDLDHHQTPSNCQGVETEATRISEIKLGSCHLSGVLPNVLSLAAHFANLTNLDLFDNAITGCFPMHLPAALQTLNIGRNQIIGRLPNQWPMSLHVLNVSHNQITGCLPHQWPASLHTLNVGWNEITGVLPKLWPALQTLYINDNQISGLLPEQWPASLRELLIHNNPELGGHVTKELLMQLNRVRCNGCKSYRDCTLQEREEGRWMRTPFVTGVSLASEDLWLMMVLRGYCNLSDGMFLDFAKAGDAQYAMCVTHGKGWVAWQEVWLGGLLKLHEREVFVLAGKSIIDTYEVSFERKFKHHTTEDEKRKACFDPKYALPDGEEAISILDWERRQLLRVATTNSLVIIYLRLDGARRKPILQPDWYNVDDGTEGYYEGLSAQQLVATEKHFAQLDMSLEFAMEVGY
jgi:hypothetical protein